MDKTFETEVITRLTVIETKLDNYQKVEEKSEVAYNTSMQNKEDIKEIRENNKWAFRTSIGALITGGISLVVTIVVAAVKFWIGVG